MGSEQSGLTDTVTVPVISNKLLRSSIEMRETSHSRNQVSSNESINAEDRAVQTKRESSDESLHGWPDQRTPMSVFQQMEPDMSESGRTDSATEYLRGDEDEQEKDLQTKFTSSSYEREYEKKLKGIQKTLRYLEDNLHETRGLESEKSFRYSQLKTKNMSLQIDLDKANKRNKNMLNLFRQNAAEIGFGCLRTSSTLPESLRKDVQRIWSQKYDTLLEQNNQLKKEATVAELAMKDKDRQIGDLQQRLLNLAVDLIQREKTIEKICTKYLSLKERKDEQEALLRGSVETLQDALQKAKSTVTQSKSENCMITSKDALIAREVRRSDRLAYENSLLRTLLQEAKRSCRSSGTSSTLSLCDKNF